MINLKTSHNRDESRFTHISKQNHVNNRWDHATTNHCKSKKRKKTKRQTSALIYKSGRLRSDVWRITIIIPKQTHKQCKIIKWKKKREVWWSVIIHEPDQSYQVILSFSRNLLGFNPTSSPLDPGSRWSFSDNPFCTLKWVLRQMKERKSVAVSGWGAEERLVKGRSSFTLSFSGSLLPAPIFFFSHPPQSSSPGGQQQGSTNI